jgi:hypothetical protein
MAIWETMRNISRRTPGRRTATGSTRGKILVRTTRALEVGLVAMVKARSVVAMSRRAKAMRSGA